MRPPFKQDVQPLGRGVVGFLTAANNPFGSISRTGRELSLNFLGERDRDGWRLYHRQSGFEVLVKPLRTLKDAERLADRLEKAADWSNVDRPTAMHGAIVSRVTGVRLERLT